MSNSKFTSSFLRRNAVIRSKLTIYERWQRFIGVSLNSCHSLECIAQHKTGHFVAFVIDNNVIISRLNVNYFIGSHRETYFALFRLGIATLHYLSLASYFPSIRCNRLFFIFIREIKPRHRIGK